MIENNELIEIKNIYNNLRSSNEPNIKTFVVIPLLNIIGFKTYEWMDLEGTAGIARSPKDIVIYVDNNDDNLLFIETKNKNTNLSQQDINQLMKYLNEVGIEWGILTNGLDYILLNDTKGLKNSEKQIFKYKLSASDIDTLKYFSYDYLFKNKVTYYYKYMNLYKHLFLKNNSKKSWQIYYCTLNNFFKYMIENKRIQYISNNSLESINPYDIKDFFNYSIEISKMNPNNKEIVSPGAIKNKFRHINNFFETLKKHSFITKNPIEHIPLEFFMNYETCSTLTEIKGTNKSNPPISIEEISKMFANCNFRDNEERNKLILLLLIFAGLDRSDLNTLEITNVDFDKNLLILNNRKVPIHKLIMSNIKDVCNINKKKGLKSKYVFASNYGQKRNRPLDASQINKIINEVLSKTDISIERQKQIDINFIRESIIKKMFQIGFHIEEISYFTGTSIKSISNYIDDEIIKLQIENDKKIYNKFVNKHPYEKLLTNNITRKIL